MSSEDLKALKARVEDLEKRLAELELRLKNLRDYGI